jgi:hypothetical protein
MENQRLWITKLFTRFLALYGNDFTRKYEGQAPDDVKDAWILVLSPYSGIEISKALESCKYVPKAPNARDFAALCHEFWSSEQERIHLQNKAPLTSDEKARWKLLVKEVMAMLDGRQPGMD